MSHFAAGSVRRNLVAVPALLLGLAGVLRIGSVRPAAEQGRGRAPATEPENGIVNERSRHPVDETVSRLEELLRSKGLKLFALVDHSGEAMQAGVKMRPTKLLIFGNPKAGTPLMLAAPSIAIDLPLKILVWEDNDGAAWISYNAPAYLARRHHVSPELMAPLRAIEGIVTAAQ